ncbi:MAG: HAMP domain-containing sensor histidine kinase [Bacteroidota bacterium]
MTRSLRTRWILVLIAVCVVQAALVAAAVRVMTARSFERFVIEEAFDLFVAEQQAQAGPVTDRPRPRRRRPPPAHLGAGIEFGLADADGRVTRPFDGYAEGDLLSPRVVSEGRPVSVDGRRIGTAFVPANAASALAPFPSDSPEGRFVSSSTVALLVALGGAVAVAVGIGVWFGGRVVRPLRELTGAAQRMAAGDLRQSVEADGPEEVAALAEAFNTMSARLAESTALRQRMTADVSHDLRTPITTVLGTLELIETGALAPTPERIRAARREAERLARLTESFHTLALADAGELPVHVSRVSPADALRQAAAAFEGRAEAAGVELRVRAEDAPDVRADPDRLGQIVGNVLANAIRHTPPGGQITLDARTEGASVAVRVADTGEGIPPDVLPNVFERSVRADGSRSGDGAGLGLSIVRSLTEAMGGTVDATSEPGRGTTVTVRLPVWTE